MDGAMHNLNIYVGERTVLSLGNYYEYDME